MGTANISDIVSNQGPVTPPPATAATGGTANLSDIISNQGPAQSGSATSAPDDTGLWAGIKRNTYGMVSGMYHAFRDPVTPQETADLARKINERNIAAGTLDPKDPNHIPSSLATNPSTVTLAYHRLVDAPADELNKKGDNELAAAKDLYDNQHKWAGVGLSVSGATDKLLSTVPMLGPYINSVADRWEKGDHIGALTDVAAAVALENAHAKITGEPAPAPNFIGKTTEAIAKPVGEVAGKATGAVVNPFRKVIAPTADVAGETFSTRPLRSAPNEAAGTQAVRNVATTTSDAAGGLPVSNAASLRDVWNEPIEARTAEAKTYYKALDDASNNQWTANQSALENVRRDIRMKSGTISEDAEAALNAKKIQLEWKQEQILDKLPAGTADAARKSWTAKSRLEDIQDIFNKKSNVSGARPEMAASGVKLPAEQYNFKGIAKDLNAMDPADLTLALGKDGAQSLVTSVNLAAKQGWATGKAMMAVRVALQLAGLGSLGHFIP